MAQRTTSRKPRSSGASRRPSTRKKGSGAPVWVWLVTGLLAGLFVAFLVFLSRFDASAPSAADARSKPAAESSAKKEGSKAPAAKESVKPAEPVVASKQASEPAKEKAEAVPAKPAVSEKAAEEPAEKPAVNYDFYKILPQYEVVVPETDPRKSATTAANTPGTYYLQVGSFRRMQEADGRKAELAMLGIVSSIQTVTVDTANTWHRVRVGPVKDMRQLDRTKRQLQENNIAFVTLKEKN